MANPLSKAGEDMLARLRKEKTIRWAQTEAKETHTLNSLVKRGLATVNKLNPNGDYCRDTFWEIK